MKYCWIALFFWILTQGLWANELASRQKNLDKIEKEIKTLQTKLSENTSQQHELEKILKKIDLDINHSAKLIAVTDEKIASLEAELQALEQQRDEAQQFLTQNEALLKQQIRQAYLQSQHPFFKILFSQDNPEKFSRVMAYSRFLSEAFSQQIVAIHHTLQIIQEAQTEIQLTLNEQTELKATQKDRQETLKAEQRMREKILATLNQDIQQQGNRVTKLKNDMKSLNTVIANLQAKQEKLSPQSHLLTRDQGQLLWPTHGKLSHKFGEPRNHADVKWNGVFIEAPEGASVKAVHAGKVVFADWLKGYGLLLIVDHGNEFMSLYAYNQSLRKQVGEMVSTQEHIATVGKSGGMTEPGLYFEIRRKGNAIDPLTWIKQQG